MTWQEIPQAGKAAIIVSAISLVVGALIFVVIYFVFDKKKDPQPVSPPPGGVPYPLGPSHNTTFGTLHVVRLKPGMNTEALSGDAGPIFQPGDQLQLLYAPSNTGFSDLGIFTWSSDGGDHYTNLNQAPSQSNQVLFTLPETVWSDQVLFRVYDANDKSKSITTGNYQVQPLFNPLAGPGINDNDATFKGGSNVQIQLQTDPALKGFTSTNTWQLLMFGGNLPVHGQATAFTLAAPDNHTLNVNFTLPLSNGNDFYWSLKSTGLKALGFPKELSLFSSTFTIQTEGTCGVAVGFALCNLQVRSLTGAPLKPADTVVIEVQYQQGPPNLSTLQGSFIVEYSTGQKTVPTTLSNVKNIPGNTNNSGTISAQTTWLNLVEAFYVEVKVNNNQGTTASLTSPNAITGNPSFTLPNFGVCTVYPDNPLYAFSGQINTTPILNGVPTSFKNPRLSISNVNNPKVVIECSFVDTDLIWRLDPTLLGLKDVGDSVESAITFSLDYVFSGDDPTKTVTLTASSIGPVKFILAQWAPKIQYLKSLTSGQLVNTNFTIGNYPPAPLWFIPTQGYDKRYILALWNQAYEPPYTDLPMFTIITSGDQYLDTPEFVPLNDPKCNLPDCNNPNCTDTNCGPTCNLLSCYKEYLYLDFTQSTVNVYSKTPDNLLPVCLYDFYGEVTYNTNPETGCVPCKCSSWAITDHV